MRYHVSHRTRFTYAEPVKNNFNEARLRPTSSGQQTCESFKLSVTPPASVAHYVDFNFNNVHHFEILRLHRELLVAASSIVITADHVPALPAGVSTPLAEMGRAANLERCHDFLQSTTFIELTPELWREALDVTAGIPDAWPAAVAMMQHIYREYRYQPNVTNVNTPANEVLRCRAGVCQDFAHVLLGLCRSVKIPARYVSGYLYNGPVDQLKGAQASHAWVEVFLPGIGWRGLDPTNNVEPDGRYIKIAIGRDYSDVPPLRGTYRGTGQRSMRVDVLVSAISPSDAVLDRVDEPSLKPDRENTRSSA
jgi:transglutaminase-like putative cysteine protease